ncbi:MAG: hypothetical protein ACTSUC_09750 [Promethearchaeota archaeon]
MPEQILDGTGSGHLVAVTSDGRMKVDLGGDITISGINIDSVVIQETDPLSDTKNNPLWEIKYLPYSGTSVGIGSVIGSVVQYIDAGSFINVLNYDDAYNVVSIGSYS